MHLRAKAKGPLEMQATRWLIKNEHGLELQRMRRANLLVLFRQLSWLVRFCREFGHAMVPMH